MALLICMLVVLELFICPAKLLLYSLFTARLRFGDGMGPGIGLCCLLLDVVLLLLLLLLVMMMLLEESLF